MTTKNKHPFDLEDRLINFANLIGQMTENLIQNTEARILCRQLLRSVSSVALNYGEAQVSQSKADLLHKMSICLKEIKESEMALRIIEIRHLCTDNKKLINAIGECGELVAIFLTCVKTIKKKVRP